MILTYKVFIFNVNFVWHNYLWICYSMGPLSDVQCHLYESDGEADYHCTPLREVAANRGDNFMLYKLKVYIKRNSPYKIIQGVNVNSEKIQNVKYLKWIRERYIRQKLTFREFWMIVQDIWTIKLPSNDDLFFPTKTKLKMFEKCLKIWLNN